MEVLIIGAGVAGLAAAQSLAAAGVQTQILEARDRIGGRVFTVHERNSGLPIELGAEFIHGRPPDLLAAAGTAGLVTPPMPDKHEYLRGGRAVDRGNLFHKVDEIFKRLSKAPDQTFSDFLRQVDAEPEVCELAVNYVEGFNAARADRIGTRSLAFEGEAQDKIGGDRAFRFQEGYDRLLQYLLERCASNAALSLNTVAEKIEWRRGHVAVRVRSLAGDSSVLMAERAIITLPLAVLQVPAKEHGAVRFDPRPPGLDHALERLEMGHAVRVTLLLSDSFWQDHPGLSDTGFIHTDDHAFPTWWTTLRGRSHGLTGWAGGPKAKNAARLEDAGIAGRAIDALARVLEAPRETIAGQVESWHFHNWSSDPFARGAYSYARVGGLDAHLQLALPVEDTLYLAGEATDTEGHAATVHGAMASGRRAARQILAPA